MKYAFGFIALLSYSFLGGGAYAGVVKKEDIQNLIKLGFKYDVRFGFSKDGSIILNYHDYKKIKRVAKVCFQN